MSTSGMATRLGCHRNSVLGWETDKTVPSLEVIVRWSRLTHVPLSWFLDEFDPASAEWASEPDGPFDDTKGGTRRYREVHLALAA